MTRTLLLALTLALAPCAPASAQTARFTAIVGGKNVSHLWADTQGGNTSVDYNVKSNGRGPTVAETITSATDGAPKSWSVTGSTTFGSKVAESFTQTDNRAEWTESTGKGSAAVATPAVYVTQSGSPWGDQVYATALLKRPGMTMPALPGGTLRLEKGETLSVSGKGGPLQVARYDLVGIDTTPETMLLDRQGHLFASVSPDFTDP